jgi:hypothetical protein
MEWVMPLLADIPPGPDARRAVRSICRTSLDELKAERPFLLTFRPLYRAALDCWDETNAVTPTGPLRR